MNCFTRCENGVIADADFYNRLQYADTASILLLSDTHGAVDAVRWILSAFSEECQACLFAGDGVQDIITVVREAAAGRITIPPVIIMTQGNCDSQFYSPVFPDARTESVERRFEHDLFALHPNASAVSARFGDHRHTEQDAHQRCLSGSVFSYQSDHLSRMNIKTHAL